MTKHHHLHQLAALHGLACEAQDPVHGDCGATATWIDRNGYVLCEACADDSLVEVAALTAGAIRALGDGLLFDVEDFLRRAEEEGSSSEHHDHVAYVVRPAGLWGPFPADDVPEALTEEPGFLLVTGPDSETTHRAAVLAARYPGGAWD